VTPRAVSPAAAAGTGHGVEPSVDSLLQRAARAEQRRILAWVIAGVLVTAGTFALASETSGGVVLVLASALALWSVRQTAGLALARRDFQNASSPPRKAYVVLVRDPNPRAVRPLLAIWDRRPARGERLPKPDSVWRCDDELDELESSAGSAELHQAWVDTGSRSWSKPRWVRADAGLAVPHRRALLGRWYVSTILRRDRPEDPYPLTIADPHAAPAGVAAEELELGGSLLGSTTGRVVFLAVVAAIVLLFA
jgi:hypothetical protein